MISLAESLGAEWGKYNIRVNAVSPGSVMTEGSTERLWKNLKCGAPTIVGLTLLRRSMLGEDLGKNAPLGRFGTSEDVVGPILFLCTPAARYACRAISACSRVLQRFPSRVFVVALAIVSAVVPLLTNCRSFITGSNYIVDGGQRLSSMMSTAFSKYVHISLPHAGCIERSHFLSQDAGKDVEWP